MRDIHKYSSVGSIFSSVVIIFVLALLQEKIGFKPVCNCRYVLTGGISITGFTIITFIFKRRVHRQYSDLLLFLVKLWYYDVACHGDNAVLF